MTVVLIIGTVLCFLVDQSAGFIALSALLIMVILSLAFTNWRYRQIRNLSQYLKRITAGEYALDVRDNREGELSILKSEIYKVTVTLSEQAELLKKDKQFLANAISDISHQLKTPITSMVVMTDLIQNEDLPEDKRIEFTQNIQTQLERLQWLVSSLLKLSRIDAGAIEFKRERGNVKALIHKASAHLLIPIEIKEQTLEISGDDSVSFMGDFNWMAEAVANILKNCTEHTPRGGRITVSFSETPLYTLIRIADNGEGIDVEDLPRIFNRFYKGKNAHNDSIGIGLAMAKSIIEKQNGVIEVKSRKGEGTEFTLKLYKGIV
jgi:signal transduction histidine kinase